MSSIPQFSRYFTPTYTSHITLCNQHKLLLREAAKLELDRMYSDKMKEVDELYSAEGSH